MKIEISYKPKVVQIKHGRILKALLFAFFSFAAITAISTPVSAAELNAKWLSVSGKIDMSDIEDAYQTQDGGWLLAGQDVGTGKGTIVKLNSHMSVTQRLYAGSSETVEATVEKGSGQTYMAIVSKYNSTTTHTSITYLKKFEKQNGSYQETIWEPATGVTIDGITYNETLLEDIVLEEDGSYVIAGFLRTTDLSHQRYFAFKIADIPTCVQQNDFSCSDIVWQIFGEDATVGSDTILSLEKTGVGEYVMITERTLIKKIVESSDHLSASFEWSVGPFTPVSYDTLALEVFIRPLGNDEFIISNRGNVQKIKVVEGANPGTYNSSSEWLTRIHTHTNHWGNLNNSIDGLDVASDGSVYVFYTMNENAEEEATIPIIANNGGVHVVTKLDSEGNIVYHMRTDQNTSFGELVVNSDGSFITANGTGARKYIDTMIYDLNYSIVSSDNPIELEPYETAQTWAGTAVGLQRNEYGGWNLNAWYDNPSLSGSKKESSSDILNADTTYYGEYTRKTFQAHFIAVIDDDQNNHIRTEDLYSFPVQYGRVMYQPTLSPEEGYDKYFWYDNDSFSGETVDFSSPDSILPSGTGSTKNFYAHVIQHTNLVNFVITSEENPEYTLDTPVRVRYGETVANPGLTNRQGFIFNGWYTDQSLSTPYDFSTPVTGGLTLYGEWINSVLKIDEEGIHYPGNVQDGTAIYDETTHTLILDNYNGGPIDITGITDDFTIILKGDNVIESQDGYGIHSNAPLTIEGDGSIDIDVTGDGYTYGCIIGSEDELTINDVNISIAEDASRTGLCARGNVNINGANIDMDIMGDGISVGIDHSDINLNGGTLNINTKYGTGFRNYNGGVKINGTEVNYTRTGDGDSEPCDNPIGSMESLVIDKGSINTDCTISTDVIIVNGGSINSGEIRADVFNQNGGKVNISPVSDPYGPSQGLESSFIVVNGGTMDIENATFGILSQEPYHEMEEITRKAAKVGAVIPENAPIEFNGGDVTVNSDVAPIIRLSNSEVGSLDSQIFVADNMIKDPDYAVLSRAEFMGGYVTVFSDGEGDIEINIDPSTGAISVKNAVKAIHIFEKKVPPVPHTDDDDEEVPETVDFQILGLACSVFIAIMLQGMIIVDLYRRLHSYEDEINQY